MKFIAAVLCVVSLSTASFAETQRESEFASGGSWTPFAIGLLPPVQVPGADWDVVGLRLGILAARHHNVLFLSASGLVDLATGDVNGVEVAGLCNHIGRSSGVFQVAGVVNSVDGDFAGVQVAGVYNAVNANAAGASVAAFNRAEAMEGLQVGVFNRAKALSGVQVGVVNLVDDGSECIQFGLVNVMRDGIYPVMPLMNIGF